VDPRARAMTSFNNQDEFVKAYLPSPFGRRAGDEGLVRDFT
jgi:hypothetical protein